MGDGAYYTGFTGRLYRDNPPQCKAYRCVVLRVLTPEGREAGKVTGTLSLHTEDQELLEAWEQCE